MPTPRATLRWKPGSPTGSLHSTSEARRAVPTPFGSMPPLPPRCRSSSRPRVTSSRPVGRGTGTGRGAQKTGEPRQQRLRVHNQTALLPQHTAVWSRLSAREEEEDRQKLAAPHSAAAPQPAHQTSRGAPASACSWPLRRRRCAAVAAGTGRRAAPAPAALSWPPTAARRRAACRPHRQAAGQVNNAGGSRHVRTASAETTSPRCLAPLRQGNFHPSAGRPQRTPTCL